MERVKLVDELGVLRATVDELETARADIVVLEQRIVDADNVVAEKQRELSNISSELNAAQVSNNSYPTFHDVTLACSRRQGHVVAIDRHRIGHVACASREADE